MNNLRDFLSRAWRWPLYSRARALCTAAVILVAALVWSNLTTPPVAPVMTAAPPSSAGGSTAPTGTKPAVTGPTGWVSSSPTTSARGDAPVLVGEQQPTGASEQLSASDGAAPAAPAPAGQDPAGATTDEVVATDPGPAELLTVPDVPRLTSDQTDYETPVAVAAAYMGAWCYQPAGQPANTNVASAATWMTAAGWEDDKARAVTDTEWAQIQQAGISTRCGPVSVSQMMAAPSTDTMQWVEIRTQQVRVGADGAIVGQSSIVQTRRILQNTDGRWLVDVQVQAG